MPAELARHTGTHAFFCLALFFDQFDDFYEEVFEELNKFGKLEDLQVCENLGDHMVGNVYAKFADEEDAARAVEGLHGRFYAGRPLICEFSPVTDFREARCRQFDENTCSRGGYCNFLHIKEPSRSLRKHLEKEHGFRSRGGDRGRDRDRDRDRSRDRRRDRSRDRRRSRSRSRDRRDRPRDDSRGRDRRDRDRERSRDKDREREPRDKDRERESRHREHELPERDHDREHDRERERERERGREGEHDDRYREYDQERREPRENDRAYGDEAPREHEYPPEH